MTTDSSSTQLEQSFDFGFPSRTTTTTTTTAAAAASDSAAGGGGTSTGGAGGSAAAGDSSGFGMGQNGTDPWSDETWGRSALLNVDVETVDTDDVFEFSTDSNNNNNNNNNSNDVLNNSLLLEEVVEELNDGEDGEEASRLFFPPDIFREVPEDPTTVHVAIHEQLSAIYDDISEDPAFQVEGSIHVKPSAEMGNSPFSLVLRDLMGHLEQVKDRTDVCQDVTDKVSKQGLHKADRVFRVMLPQHVLAQNEVPIAQYTCSSSVRPIPLLIKSRVQVSTRFSRVGFKIRANPSNEHPMTHLVIMLAVPPHVDGRSAKMSRRGGVWDEMKRTISWVVPKLDAGETLEVQAQFEAIDGETDRTPKFPVLVRGDYPSIFSSLELKADFRDVLSQPINMKLSLSGRVLHRRV